MKHLAKLVALPAVVLAVGLAPTGATLAGGDHFSIHYSTGYHGGGSYSYGNKHRKQYKHGKHYNKRRGGHAYYPFSHKRRGYGHSYGHGGRAYDNSYGYKRHSYGRGHEYRGCHKVSKYDYDSYGRKVKIGGTMCYDNYGSGYIVPGSRYLIGEYGH